MRRATGIGLVGGWVAVVALGGMTVGLGARQGEETATVFQVCVAADGTMRLASPPGCPPGQKSVYLQKAQAGIEKADDPAPDEAKSADATRIADLERRVAALERPTESGTIGNTVVAPFVVVDSAGQRVFEVNVGDVRVYQPGARASAVVLGASDQGGSVRTLSAHGNLQASIGAVSARAGLIVSENDVERVNMGRQPAGHYAAKFFGKSGTFVAGLGQVEKGTGAVLVMDHGGTIRASAGIDDAGKGYVHIKNGANAVAELTEGKTGGGLLTIGSSSGERMVAAGVQVGGFGVVQAGPASFMTAAGLGLPGSYIMGKP